MPRLAPFVLAFLAYASSALAQPPVIDFYSLPKNGTAGPLAAGPDGAMWFTMSTCDDLDPGCATDVRHDWIGRLSVTGAITTFPLPFNPMPLGQGTYGLATGPDGALWFTEIRGRRIGRMTTSGALTYYPLPGEFIAPYLIAAGSDGALWFTDLQNGIGRITTGGAITRYPIGISGAPIDITAGPDGALWFTEMGNPHHIGRITTAGAMTLFPLPDFCGPLGITTGPDGALWFGCLLTSAIGRITTDGTLSNYPVTPLTGPSYLAPGPDGAVWFTEQYGFAIGRITPAGVLDEYPLSSPGFPHDIAAGPGGVWFTALHEIGRIRFADSTAPTINGMPDTSCSLWPPNHRLRQVAHITASDSDSGLAPAALLVTVTSNEPQLPGAPDTVVTGDGSGGFVVELRADRRGGGSGRVYTIVATATDNAGNVARATAACTVPHDARR